METQHWNEGTLLQLVSSMEKLSRAKRRELLKSAGKSLLKDLSPLPLNHRLCKYFSKHFTGNHTWDCLHIRWLVEQGNIASVKEAIKGVSKKRRVKVLLYLSKVWIDRNDYLIALAFTEQAYAREAGNVLVLRRLVTIHHRLGNITDREAYLRQLKARSGNLYPKELECAQDEKLLMDHVWQWDNQSNRNGNRAQIKLQQGNTIVHVLNKFYPEINGYTVRSMDIIKHQREAGLQAVVVTKLGWPPYKDHYNGYHTLYDNIKHYSLSDDNHSQLNKVPMSEYFQIYTDQFAELLQRLKPKVIHAASNFQNALPPLTVAHQLGIPSVYEVRGLWHYTQCSKTKNYEVSERFHLHKKYELLCCQLADQVVVICDSLKRHLIELGVSPQKIHVIYNGVNVNEFRPELPLPELVDAYGLKDKLVIGFIGSVERYEGLDILLQALAILKDKRPEMKLLIVGEGPALPELQILCRKLNIEERVLFLGKVPRKEVNRLYALMDVLPFPRTKDAVCKLVTPLKPYEAMAMGKAVLVSDIPALREMVIEGETGRVFQPEDAVSLAECLNQSHLFPELGRKAREWIVSNRDWKQITKGYKVVYRLIHDKRRS